MTRKTRCALAILLSLAFVGVVRAQSEEQQKQQPAQPPQAAKPDARQEHREHTPEPFENFPRYAWWKDEKAKAAAGFSTEQAAEIERIFKESMEKTRPMAQEVFQLRKALSETIDANTADIPVVARQIEKVESLRAEVNKLRLVMLYRMQRVLLPEQKTKLVAYFERREAERKKESGDRRK